MTVAYTFASRTSSIPLSELDANFATATTLGNVSFQLGNVVTTVGNLTLTNVTISSGTATLGNITYSGSLTGGSASLANVTYTGTLTGGTGVVNLGSGQLYKDASGNLGVGAVPSGTKFDVGGNIRLSATDPVIELNTGGPQFFVPAANTLGIATGGGIGSAIERARFSNSGDFIPILQTSVPALATNNQMVFTLTSNTNLRISVRGSDGTTRTANITLA